MPVLRVRRSHTSSLRSGWLQCHPGITCYGKYGTYPSRPVAPALLPRPPSVSQSRSWESLQGHADVLYYLVKRLLSLLVLFRGIIVVRPLCNHDALVGLIEPFPPVARDLGDWPSCQMSLDLFQPALYVFQVGQRIGRRTVGQRGGC